MAASSASRCVRLEAAVGDDPERIAIREVLAFGKGLHAHLRPLAAGRGQLTRVQPRRTAQSACPGASVNGR